MNLTFDSGSIQLSFHAFKSVFNPNVGTISEKLHQRFAFRAFHCNCTDSLISHYC